MVSDEMNAQGSWLIHFPNEMENAWSKFHNYFSTGKVSRYTGHVHTHTQSRPQRLSLGLRWAKQNDSLFKKKPITHLKENIFIFLGAIFFLRPWEEKEHVAAWKKRERWDERITRVTFFLKESYEKICPQSIFFKFFNVTFFLNS